MKWMVGLIMAAALAGCGEQTNKGPELQENTEEYIRAHGIVPGQVNELRIGETLFRFPAGVGLNPNTAAGVPLLADGGKGTPLANEPKRIVTGRADRVTFYLDGGRTYQPRPEAYGSRGGDATIRVQISTGYVERPVLEPDPKWDSNAAEQRAVSSLGLRAFIVKNQKAPGSARLFYMAPKVKSPRGNAMVIQCEPRYDATNGFLEKPGYCAATYQALQGFAVTYGFSGYAMLPRWQQIHLAVTDFIDSIVVK